MILFIAPNPHKIKEREGFLQRVAAIDEVFNTEERIYSEDIHDNRVLAEHIMRADVIYVHSIYRANMIIEYYPLFGEKIITDLHGIVPEEEEYAGNSSMYDVMSKVEQTVFENSSRFVAVTNAMVSHFKHKYKLAKDARWVVLPIFDTKPLKRKDLKSEPDHVVYAGGTQPWQNISKMVDAINLVGSDYKFDILTHDPAAFGSVKEVNMSHVSIKTVSSDQVAEYYKRAHLGFVLRDDVLVNRVACPTKLIEYLGSGVVPIIVSSKIGDFRELGYQYVTYNQFISGKKLSYKKYIKAVETNYAVFNRLVEQSKKGKRDLLDIYREAKTNKHLTSAMSTRIIEVILSNKDINASNEAMRAELTKNQSIIEEQKDYIKELELTINNIRGSMRWRVAKLLSSPIRIISKLYSKFKV